jgi:hypothetical protein
MIDLMGDPTLAPDKTLDAPWARPTPGEGEGKKLPRFVPCKSLISLDSDERIQGNPNKYNPRILGFCYEAASGQENPNGSTLDYLGAMRRAPSMRIVSPLI